MIASMRRPAAGPGHEVTLWNALDAIRQEATGVLLAGLFVGCLTTVSYYLLAQFRFLLYPLALPTRSEEAISAIAILLLFWAVAYGCLTHLRPWLQMALAYRMAHRLSVPAIAATTDLRERGQDEAAQALRDVEEVKQCVQGPILTAAVDCALVPLMVVMLATLHWAFMLLVLASGIIQGLVAYFSQALVMPRLEAANTTQNRAMVAMADAVNAAEAVEAMGFLPALTRRWGSDVHGGVDEMARTQRAHRMTQSISGFIAVVLGVSPVVMMTIFSISDIDPGMNGAVGMIALLVMPAITGPFVRITSMVTEIATARRAWARLTDLAKREQGKGQGVFLCDEGVLAVHALTVQLPGMQQPILQDLSFRVRPGQIIGLSGPVGSGKSTLLRAIIGIQQPTSGGCYLDGHATSQWDRQDFARHVGYLPQEIGIANGTVADVIARLGVPNMHKVIEAAERVGAHGFIVALPNGYSTRLTEHALSAGQRQRLGLARAIYGRPRVLVLDEPGAWLDAAGLAQLRRLITLLRRESVSVIFASHEPGLLDEADHTVSLGRLGERPRASSRKVSPALVRPAAA